MSNSIELARKTYEKAMDWYKDSRSKAKILLGVFGTFAGILYVVLYRKPEEVKNIIGRFKSMEIS